jgi:23S rRNA (uracil1939-C5)-methyltransferase
MLARSAGQVVFVQGGIPGERVHVAPGLRKRGYLETEALYTSQAAPSRTVPPCHYFGENGLQRGAIDAPAHESGPVCGGCQYQHIEYAAQLQIKRTVLQDVLRRVGKILEAPVQEPIASPAYYQYRNKASWLITSDGEPAYRSARSHTPVPIDLCHLLTPETLDLLGTIRVSAAEIGLAGLVQEVEARALKDGEGRTRSTLVLDLAAAISQAEAHALADALMEISPDLESIAATQHGGGGDVVILAGSQRHPARFLDQTMLLSPTTFFQVNVPAAELLVSYALQQCGSLEGRQILDLYSGAGTFTLPLARQADAVIAMEIDAGAVADARAMLATQGLENVTLLQGDAAANLHALLPGTVDCVVLDPPRSGCAPAVIRQLVRIKIPRLVYVSCDAATLARDLRLLLDAGYELEALQPVDLFPQTAHIESVSTLRLARKFRVRR